MINSDNNETQINVVDKGVVRGIAPSYVLITEDEDDLFNNNNLSSKRLLYFNLSNEILRVRNIADDSN
jgi:hypothetical protein